MSVASAGRLMGPKWRSTRAIPISSCSAIRRVGFIEPQMADRVGRHRSGTGPAGCRPAIAFAFQTGPGASTNVVYAATGANGVYRSTDGGLSWTRTQGGPRSVDRIVAAPDALYVTDRDETAAENAWKFASGRWARLAIAGHGGGNGWHSIAVDPRDPRHVVLGMAAGNIVASSDGGITWGAFFKNSPDRVATDVPWLAWAAEPWMSNGNMMFDPVLPNRLYFAQGIGVWHTKPPIDDTKPKWSSQTRGIDELIVNDLTVPQGGKPVFARCRIAAFSGLKALNFSRRPMGRIATYLSVTAGRSIMQLAIRPSSLPSSTVVPPIGRPFHVTAAATGHPSLPTRQPMRRAI